MRQQSENEARRSVESQRLNEEKLSKFQECVRGTGTATCNIWDYRLNLNRKAGWEVESLIGEASSVQNLGDRQYWYYTVRLDGRLARLQMILKGGRVEDINSY